MSETVRHIEWDELAAMLADAQPPTPDDVSITSDGRRLDSKVVVLEFLAELEAERAHRARQ